MARGGENQLGQDLNPGTLPIVIIMTIETRRVLVTVTIRSCVLGPKSSDFVPSRLFFFFTSFQYFVGYIRSKYVLFCYFSSFSHSLCDVECKAFNINGAYI